MFTNTRRKRITKGGLIPNSYWISGVRIYNQEGGQANPPPPRNQNDLPCRNLAASPVLNINLRVVFYQKILTVLGVHFISGLSMAEIGIFFGPSNRIIYLYIVGFRAVSLHHFSHIYSYSRSIYIFSNPIDSTSFHWEVYKHAKNKKNTNGDSKSYSLYILISVW